jgi:hypothetical protein
MFTIKYIYPAYGAIVGCYTSSVFINEATSAGKNAYNFCRNGPYNVERIQK